MALTGAFLFGWIFLHMVGNLKLYLGPEHMNEYAKWLRVMGAPAGADDDFDAFYRAEFGRLAGALRLL